MSLRSHLNRDRKNGFELGPHGFKEIRSYATRFLRDLGHKDVEGPGLQGCRGTWATRMSRDLGYKDVEGPGLQGCRGTLTSRMRTGLVKCLC